MLEYGLSVIKVLKSVKPGLQETNLKIFKERLIENLTIRVTNTP